MKANAIIEYMKNDFIVALRVVARGEDMSINVKYLPHSIALFAPGITLFLVEFMKIYPYCSKAVVGIPAYV